jgi:hypothetical protein
MTPRRGTQARAIITGFLKARRILRDDNASTAAHRIGLVTIAAIRYAREWEKK